MLVLLIVLLVLWVLGAIAVVAVCVAAASGDRTEIVAGWDDAPARRYAAATGG